MNISSTCKEDGHSHLLVATHSLHRPPLCCGTPGPEPKQRDPRRGPDEPTRSRPWDTELGERQRTTQGAGSRVLRMAALAATSTEFTDVTVRGKAQKEKQTSVDLWQTQT